MVFKLDSIRYTMKIKLAGLIGGILLYLFTTSVLAQAVWKQYSGPFSGEITSFATYGDTIFVGSNMTGVFKSIDKGKTWTHTFPEIMYAYSLYIHNNALFIGSDKLYKYSPSGLIQVGQAVQGVVSYMQTHNGELFVTTGPGLYKYEPSSNELVLKLNGLPATPEGIYWMRDMASLDNVLFCNALSFGLYKSTDEGEYWEKVDVNGYNHDFHHMTTRGDSLICVINDFLFVSTNKGATWNDIKYNLSGSGALWRLIALDDRLITVSIFSGTYELKDGAMEWIRITEREFTDMNYNGETLLASDPGGLYRWSDEDKVFVLSNIGINTSRVNEIELFNGKIYSATERGVHFTSTDGDDWNIVPELRDAYVKTIKKSGSNLFAGTSEGLYVTSATSTSWSKFENFPSVGIWDIEVNGNKIFVASDEGVYLSKNDGDSWKSLPNSHSPYKQMIHLGVNDSMLVAGNTSGLYRILPDSSDWEKINFFESEEIFSLNIIDSVIYASSMNSGIIYRSFDYGRTWNNVSISTTARVQMIKRGDNIYAADYNKIFYSSDGGTTWDYFYETGMPDILTCITEGDSAFYAGTYGKSIWRRPFLSMIDINSEVYTIHDSLIYNIDPNTTVEDFKSNVTLSYGTSVEIEKSNGTESGRVKSTNNIQKHDKIKIIAEDGKNMRILKVAKGSLVTSIGEMENKTFEAFPIPAQDKLFIRDHEKIKSCIIINSVGQKVLQPILQHNYIDVSTLPSGLYVLTVMNSANKKQVLKFIKD